MSQSFDRGRGRYAGDYCNICFCCSGEYGRRSPGGHFYGKKENEKAQQILGNCFVLLILTALLLTAVLQIFGKPILLLFGASENTIGYADFLHLLCNLRKVLLLYVLIHRF